MSNDGFVLALSLCNKAWWLPYYLIRASLVSQRAKTLPVMQETQIPSLGSGNSPGEGNDNPLHSSCLENPMDRGGDWQVHGVAKSWTLLSDKHFHFHCLMNHCRGCDNSQGLSWRLCISVFRSYIYKGKVHSFSFFPKIQNFSMFIGFKHDLFCICRLSLELLVRFSV